MFLLFSKFSISTKKIHFWSYQKRLGFFDSFFFSKTFGTIKKKHVLILVYFFYFFMFNTLCLLFIETKENRSRHRHLRLKVDDVLFRFSFLNSLWKHIFLKNLVIFRHVLFRYSYHFKLSFIYWSIHPFNHHTNWSIQSSKYPYIYL